MIRRLLALLPRAIRNPIGAASRVSCARLTHSVLYIAAKSPVLSSLYYLCFSSAFRRELHAVAYGRWKHLLEERSDAGTPFQLRRNIHRIEKGLIMRPRRGVFAAGYIESTVLSYERQLSGAYAAGGTLPDELVWATHVLEAYFATVNGDKKIEHARNRFEAARACWPGGNGPRLAPFRRDLDPPATVEYSALLQLAQRRRSVRWFVPAPVERTLIDKAIEVALLSPSACNRQPYRFWIFDDPEDVRRVASVPMGTSGFSHNFPAVVVLVGRQRAYFSERDRHVIYIDASLAAMSFVLALETLGLSSCCINWPDMEPQEQRMAELLNLEPDERIVMLIAVGHPDPNGMVPYSQKMALSQARVYSHLTSTP